MEMISKKELLELTGISYGQLYRWKREKLIPEDWFMKQSSYTGQETFFPREQMVARVKSIMELKDSYTLEELAKMLEPDAAARIYREDLDLIAEIDRTVLDKVLSVIEWETFRLTDVAFFILISQVRSRGCFDEGEFEDLVIRSLPGVLERRNWDFSCTFFKAEGKYHIAFSRVDSGLMFDAGITVMETAVISQILSNISITYSHLFH